MQGPKQGGSQQDRPENLPAEVAQGIQANPQKAEPTQRFLGHAGFKRRQ